MKSQLKTQQGFTLIEMITAMAVAAILLGSAGPNFFEFVESSRSSTEYRSLLKGLQLARSEAINRGVNVTVAAADNADWHSGFTVWADENGDGVRDDAEIILVQDAFGSDATLVENNSTAAFSYTPEGFLDAVTGAEFALAYRTDSKCQWDRDIRLVYTGHVSARERACDQ